MRRQLFGQGGDNSAAVAPTVALSMFLLIGAGGVAFDYARMAALDTELQTAADQAALAAATQLDQTAGSCARAAAAANNLVAHQTAFANEAGGTRLITVFITGVDDTACNATDNVRFYQDKAKTTPANADSNANFVEVWVNGRVANFALTPILAAFDSGQLRAAAYAGLGSAICKVPPFFMCPPAGVGTDPDAWKGWGLKLFQGGGNSWAPGNFGYIDVGAANNGSPDQRMALAYNATALSCVSEGGANVDTGVSASVIDVINVRFDIFLNGWSRNTCYPSTNCSPAANVTKDLVRDPGETPSSTSCGIANNSEWQLPDSAEQYIPSNDAGDDSNIVHMGYPMDICHFEGRTACPNGRLGNGSWRRDLYFKTNHQNLSDSSGSNWQTQTGLGANATRHDFYKWELANSYLPSVAGSDGLNQYGSPVCKSGVAAGPNQPDRRVIAMAVATNCGSLGGSNTAVQIGNWAEVFLVQPSADRDDAGTIASEIYVEIIGKAEPSGDGTNAQLVKRDVPYLIQ